MGEQTSGKVPGPAGREVARVLAGMARDPLATCLRVAGQYGEAARVPLAPGRALYLLTRPEYAEHVLASGQDSYVKAFTYRPLRALLGDGLLTSEGEAWRRRRRLIQPVFSRRDVLGFGPHMTVAARRLVQRWDRMPDGATVDVGQEMSALSLEIAGRALFGADLTGDAEEIRRSMTAGQWAGIAATFLPLSWGPRSTRMLRTAIHRIARTPEGVDGIARRMIAARRAAGAAAPAAASADGTRADGTGGQRPSHDLLAILLAARDEGGVPLNDTEIQDELITFLLAGHETSANTLCWALALLSAYPAARGRLTAELDTVLGDREPEAADAAQLPWPRAVVAEALRLYPPAWTIERDAVRGNDAAGVLIPARSTVAILPYLIQRHPEFWPNPVAFDPGRFLPGGHGDPATRHRYAYIPFGGGRRACIGSAFAELEVTLVLATIMRRYQPELTASGMPRPLAQITLRPGRRLPMRLRRRAAVPAPA
jgi:cytochrome P450